MPLPVEGRKHVGVSAVQTIKILPKPITKENKVQTDEFIDCPVIFFLNSLAITFILAEDRWDR